MMTQGEYIRKARLDAGLTLDEVAKACHTTKQTIYKYENDIVTNIPMDKIKIMSDLLDVSPTQLLGWETSPEPGYDYDLMELREQLRRSPETRMLFSVTKNATPEQIKLVAEMLKQWKHVSE